MASLLSKVIKLAHQNPDLRPHLLPLVRASQKKTARVELVTLTSGQGNVYLEADDLDALFRTLKGSGFRPREQDGRLVVPLTVYTPYRDVITALETANYDVDAN